MYGRRPLSRRVFDVRSLLSLKSFDLRPEGGQMGERWLFESNFVGVKLTVPVEHSGNNKFQGL